MEPIITSLLDTDFYKFTMGQFAWKYYPNVKVKYAFINRTQDVKLLLHIQDLIAELDNVRNLKFSMSELNYLKSLGIFDTEYLNYLSKLSLPPVFAENRDGKLIIETEGLWAEAIFWETFILSIVNELHFRRNTPIGYIGEFHDRLDEKMAKIRKNPIKFIEFGTRRRFSWELQQRLISDLSTQFYRTDIFVGTSNVSFAKEFDLTPIGTMAHELPMVVAGLNDYNTEVLRHSHDKAMSAWFFMYGEPLSIALTDTFGTDFFFQDFNKEKAAQWKGLRQDSGNPLEFGYKAIKFYNELGIDPKEKLIVFSDGLTLEKIQEIEKEFKGIIQLAYGWGTNLTNDVGASPLSIVVKAVEANGRPLVKLSDNLAKALGPEKTVEKYKKAFGYQSTYEEPLYY